MRAFLLAALLLFPLAHALDLSDVQIVVEDTQTRLLLETPSARFVTAQAIDSSQDILLIGGPCAQQLWQRYASFLTCDNWPFDEGEGIILSLEEATLIAGTTVEDTRLLVREYLLAQTIDEGDDGGTGIIVTDGEDRIATQDGMTIDIEDVIVSASGVSLTVEGDRLDNIMAGRTSLANGDLLVRVLSIDGETARITITEFDETTTEDNEITVEEGEDDSLSFSGMTIDIEDLSISDDEVDVMIGGRDFTDMEEGSRRTFDGTLVELEDVNEDEATFRFEELDDEEHDEGDSFTLYIESELNVEIEGETIDFEDLSISGGTATIDAEGDTNSNLAEDDTFDVNGIEFRVENINDEDITLSVESI